MKLLLSLLLSTAVLTAAPALADNDCRGNCGGGGTTNNSGGRGGNGGAGGAGGRGGDGGDALQGQAQGQGQGQAQGQLQLQGQGQAQGQGQGQAQQANGGASTAAGGSSAASSSGPAGSGNATSVVVGGSSSNTYYSEPYVLPAPAVGNNSMVNGISCPTTTLGLTGGGMNTGAGYGYGNSGSSNGWAFQGGITIPLGVGTCHAAQKAQAAKSQLEATYQLAQMCRNLKPEEIEKFAEFARCK